MSNPFEAIPQGPSPQLIKLVNQARQTYSGFSDKEQLAVCSMRDLDSFYKILKDPK